MKLMNFGRKKKLSDIWKKLIFDKSGSRISPTKFFVCLLVAVLSISIGYSAVASNLNITGLIASIRLKQDIRITGIGIAGTSGKVCSLGDINNNEVADVGEMVSCGSENFYVMESTSSTVTMLAEKNISLPTVVATGTSGEYPKQSDNAGTLNFSNYMGDIDGDGYYDDGYWQPYTSEGYTEYPLYVYDSNSNLYPYVEAYEYYLKKVGITSVDAKIPSVQQLEKLGCTWNNNVCRWYGNNSWIYSTNYWLGSAGSCGWDSQWLWGVETKGHGGSMWIGNNVKNYADFGIRPVVTVSKNEIGIFSYGVSGGKSNYAEYNKKNVGVGVYLPNSDSAITYKVEVTNIGNVEMGLLSIGNIPSNIEIEFTDDLLRSKDYETVCDGDSCTLEVNEKICDEDNVCKLGIKKEYYITVKYKSGGYNSSKTTYDLNLTFDFLPAYDVKYTDIENNEYPDVVLEGKTLNVTFVNDIPEYVNVLIGGNQTDNYTYVNGTLSVFDINGNVEIQSISEVQTGGGYGGTETGGGYDAGGSCSYTTSGSGDVAAGSASVTVDWVYRYSDGINYESGSEIISFGYTEGSTNECKSAVICNGHNDSGGNPYTATVCGCNSAEGNC